jgi:hypothetical protein
VDGKKRKGCRSGKPNRHGFLGRAPVLFAQTKIWPYSKGMTDPAQTIITVRNEIRGPIVVLLAFWFVAALIVAVFARSIWLLAAAGSGILASVVLLAWALMPRRGDLLRLVLDRPRGVLYWAHHGTEPEEIPFSALRAVAIEPAASERFVHLWAVDTLGHWASLGRGLRNEMETFAKEVADTVDVPLWYREADQSPGVPVPYVEVEQDVSESEA